METNITDNFRRLYNDLMSLPYGKKIRNGEKILPPSWFEYAYVVDEIIGELTKVLNNDSDIITYNDVQYVHSLRVNDVNRAIADRCDHKDIFEISGCDEEMLRISDCIVSVISRFIM